MKGNDSTAVADSEGAEPAAPPPPLWGSDWRRHSRSC